MNTEHTFVWTESTGVYKYAKVLGIKKDTNPISIVRNTTTLRYIFNVRFITNQKIDEIKISVILHSDNGNVDYQILSTNIPTEFYQHMPIIVKTDSGCDIYLCTLKESGFGAIEVERGELTNLVFYPVGYANISEQTAFNFENQINPVYINNKIQSSFITEISTDYGTIYLVDLHNGSFMFKFIGNGNTLAETTKIAEMPSNLIPRTQLNANACSLISFVSSNGGGIRIKTNGDIEAKIGDTYSIGQMLVVI